jgi:hypothetical protein
MINKIGLDRFFNSLSNLNSIYNLRYTENNRQKPQ